VERRKRLVMGAVTEEDFTDGCTYVSTGIRGKSVSDLSGCVSVLRLFALCEVHRGMKVESKVDVHRPAHTKPITVAYTALLPPKAFTAVGRVRCIT